MECRVLGALIVVGVLTGVPAWVGAQSGKSVVEGAWVLQDFNYAKSPPPVRLNKPLGMLLFSGNHYAFVIVRDSGPRPEVGPEGLKGTAEDLRSAWGPLQAQAGTIQIAGNLLTTRANVSKGNIPMEKGSFLEFTFSVKGDTLTMVTTKDQTGPEQNPRTWLFVRAK